MSRLTPDDAREAEIRRFLVNYDPQSDLPFLVGRLDSVRAERDATDAPTLLINTKGDVETACRVDGRGERDYLVYAHRQLQSALDKRDDAPCSSSEHAMAAKVALLLERVPTYPEIVAQWEHESRLDAAVFGLVKDNVSHLAHEIRLVLNASPVVTEDPRLTAIRAYCDVLRDFHWRECECDLGEDAICKSPSEIARVTLLALLDAPPDVKETR
jgi:hypothetical protein